jgi:hypothetical protein
VLGDKVMYSIKGIILFLILIFSTSSFAAENTIPLILEGIELKTIVTESNVESAEFITDMTLPDDSVLLWPYVFQGDLNNTTVTASFEGSPLLILNADTLIQDEIETLIFDIDNYKGQTGELKIVLNSTGEVPASLFLIQNAEDWVRSGSWKIILPLLLNNE